MCNGIDLCLYLFFLDFTRSSHKQQTFVDLLCKKNMLAGFLTIASNCFNLYNKIVLLLCLLLLSNEIK